jgi:hypothetical protein
VLHHLADTQGAPNKAFWARIDPLRIVKITVVGSSGSDWMARGLGSLFSEPRPVLTGQPPWGPRWPGEKALRSRCWSETTADHHARSTAAKMAYQRAS